MVWLESRGSITLFTQDDKPGAPGQTLQIGGVPEKEKGPLTCASRRGFVYTLPKKLEEIPQHQTG